MAHEITLPVIDTQGRRGSRGWLLIVLRWAAALIVLGVLLHFLPLQPLRAAIARIPASRFLAVLLGYLLAHCIGVGKWRMVVNAAGAQLDFATSAQCYFGGLFGTLFLPSIVGGDVVGQAGLVLLGVLLVPELDLVPDEWEDRLEIGFLAFAAAVILLLIVVYRLRKRIFAGRSMRFRRRLARLRHALRAVSKRPKVLVLGWLLGSCIQAAFLMLTAQLAVYCGLTLPLRAWLFAWPLAKLAAVLPLTQGGIGVREAALGVLLAPFGAPGHLVLAAGLVWEGVVIAGGLIAGAVAFTLGKRADRTVMR